MAPLTSLIALLLLAACTAAQDSRSISGTEVEKLFELIGEADLEFVKEIRNILKNAPKCRGENTTDKCCYLIYYSIVLLTR